MQRLTVTLDHELVAEIDRFIETRSYQSRSEALRDLVRSGLHQADGESGEGKNCIAALAYVYDHGTRELAKRLADVRREHHDLTIATTTVDLGHESSFEVTLLRGATASVRRLASTIIAGRGVRHGRLSIVPVDIARDSHAHGSGSYPHDHYRVREAG